MIDLSKQTDTDLLKQLEGMSHVDGLSAVIAELTRRSVMRLADSSEKLETLTKRLFWLTVALAVIALPPAIDVVVKVALLFR